MPHTDPLADKTIIVTGATAGIGLQSLLQFAGRGAWLIAVARDASRCDEAERLVLTHAPHAKVQFLLADLSLQSEVRRLANEIVKQMDQASRPGLDVLCNVAGMYSSRRASREGIELTLAVNHLAPFLLSYQLLPLLQRVQGRIINVNSASHRGTFIRPHHLNQDCMLHGLIAYKSSKLANLLTSAEFNRRYGARGVRALCLDPGLVNTDIGCKNTSGLDRLIWDRRQRLGSPPSVPAHALVQLAELPSPEALYWRDGKPFAPSRRAYDVTLAAEVWQASCELCGIDPGAGVGKHG